MIDPQSITILIEAAKRGDSSAANQLWSSVYEEIRTIAKRAIDKEHGPLTVKTLFTSFQQMIGTLEYMIPEQAEISILDADTRSDVFLLGVIAANESIRNGRRATTLDLLGECPANKRGIEWRWLSYLAADRSIALMPASKDDETGLLIGGKNGRIQLLHVAARKPCSASRTACLAVRAPPLHERVWYALRYEGACV